jgi:hypothetical protein
MPGDLEALVSLMPFAAHLGVVLDEASADRVIARLEWAPRLCTSGGIRQMICAFGAEWSAMPGRYYSQSLRLKTI